MKKEFRLKGGIRRGLVYCVAALTREFNNIKEGLSSYGGIKNVKNWHVFASIFIAWGIMIGGAFWGDHYDKILSFHDSLWLGRILIAGPTAIIIIAVNWAEIRGVLLLFIFAGFFLGLGMGEGCLSDVELSFYTPLLYPLVKIAAAIHDRISNKISLIRTA